MRTSEIDLIETLYKISTQHHFYNLFYSKMDPNLYHTIPGGIEAKVSDIIILLLNCFILGGLVAAYTAYRVYQTINEKKAKKSVTLGPMTHLGTLCIYFLIL